MGAISQYAHILLFGLDMDERLSMTSRVGPIAWNPFSSMTTTRLDKRKCDANSSASQMGPSLASPSPTIA